MDDLIPWLDCDPYTHCTDLTGEGKERFFKTHVPFSWLPFSPETKYIYVARNPKDVAVSFFYFLENTFRQVGITKDYEVDMNSFIDLFGQGSMIYGDWWAHVNSWYDASLENSNVLFLTYEELSSDMAGVIKQIAEFMGKKLTEERVSDIALQCTFNKMKTSSKASMAYVNNFWRKGVVGDHVNHFSNKQIEDFDIKSQSCLPATLMNRLGLS